MTMKKRLGASLACTPSSNHESDAHISEDSHSLRQTLPAIYGIQVKRLNISRMGGSEVGVSVSGGYMLETMLEAILPPPISVKRNTATGDQVERQIKAYRIVR